MSVSQEDILSFQSKAIDYLYDIMPAANESLFIAYINDDKRNVPNSRYRVKSINVPTPTISMTMDDGRKRSYPSKVEFHDDVTIEWYEDAWNSVQKYHLDVMQSIVHLDTGIFNTNIQPISEIVIVRYVFKEGVTSVETPFDSMPVPEIADFISLTSLTPISVGDIHLDSSASGDMKTVSISYKVKNIMMNGVQTMKTKIDANDFGQVEPAPLSLL